MSPLRKRRACRDFPRSAAWGPTRRTTSGPSVATHSRRSDQPAFPSRAIVATLMTTMNDNDPRQSLAVIEEVVTAVNFLKVGSGGLEEPEPLDDAYQIIL